MEPAAWQWNDLSSSLGLKYFSPNGIHRLDLVLELVVLRANTYIPIRIRIPIVQYAFIARLHTTITVPVEILTCYRILSFSLGATYYRYQPLCIIYLSHKSNKPPLAQSPTVVDRTALAAHYI